MSQDIRFDIIANDRASKTFDKIATSANRSKSKFVAFGRFAAAGLAGATVATAALGVKFAKMAIDDEASSKKLAKALQDNAGATKKQIGATEDWITAQGKAYGVADDDLRPALVRLVAATHDVGKSQKLASLAMNVSAGTGKDLGAVSMALAKAQAGNVGALGRLGIATKDAHGKTLSFEAITRKLAHTYRGQAATAANTAAGRFERVKLAFSETAEAIGYHLLPIASKIANWLLSTGIPAFEAFAHKVSQGADAIRGVFDRINFAAITARVTSLFDSANRGAGKTGTLLNQFKNTVSSVFSSVISIYQSLAGFAQKFWGRYGDLITKFGIGTMRNLVTDLRGAMNIIAGIFKTVAAVLRGDWGGAWAGLKQIARGGGQVIKGVVSQLWNVVRTLFAAGTRALGDLMIRGWDAAVSGARAGAAKVIRTVTGLPGRIMGAIGDLSGLLVNAGKSVISGLISGITSKIGELTSKLHSITNLIPKHKGPIEKDRKLLEPAGRAIMDGLIGGIEGRKVTLKKALAKVTAVFDATREKISSLSDMRAGFLSTFSAESIFGADLTDGGGAGALVTFAQQQASQAAQLLADVQNVVSRGLSKELVSQLQSQGTSGAAALHALASGSADQIAQLNSLNVATQSSLQAAGMVAGNYVRGGNINADINSAQAQEALLNRLVDRLEKLQNEKYIVVEIEGDHIVKAVKKRNKRKGVATAGM